MDGARSQPGGRASPVGKDAPMAARPTPIKKTADLSEWEGKIATLDSLAEVVQEVFKPVAHTVGKYGTFLVQGLTVMQRDIALDAARANGGSVFKIQVAVVSQGLVLPKANVKQIGSWPAELVQGLYDKIMELTKPEEDAEGADGPVPFPIASGSSTFWQTDSGAS
jgi:hypothetical protein